MNRFCIFLLSALALSPSASYSDSFFDVFSACAIQYDVQVDENLAEDLQQSVSGRASLDINAFVELFPPSDRLDAYRIFDGCLSRSYEATEGGQNLLLDSRIGDALPNSSSSISSGLRPIDVFIQGGQRERIPLVFQGNCQVRLAPAAGHEVRTQSRFVISDSGKYLSGSVQMMRPSSSNFSQFTAPSGVPLSLELWADNRDTAGWVRLMLRTQC